MPKRASIVLILLCTALLIACSKPGEQPATAPPTSPSAENAPGGGAPPSSTARRGALPGTEARKVVVPEGTEMTVRLAQAVGSKISQSGDSFTAHVVEPVEVNGVVAIPKDAEVAGHVAEAVPRGRFKGAAKLRLALDSVSVGGKQYPVSGGVSRVAKGKGKRTATMIGGGAGLGALIGGLAGGGKGAAIGAVAGAGAGTAGSAFTGNKDIVLPAEAALTFKLQQPVTIR